MSPKLVLSLIIFSFAHAQEHKIVEKFFSSKPSQISVREVYEGSRIIERTGYSIDGTETVRTNYDYEKSNSTYLKTIHRGGKISEKVREKNIDGKITLLEKYGFHHRTNELLSIDTYVNGVVTKRRVIKDKSHDYSYTFKYDQERIIGFDVLDKKGKIIGDYYQNSIEELPSGSKAGNVKIAILDSGFDHGHRDIINHLIPNELDPLDGIDNDGDGFVDNYLGVFYDEDGDLSFKHFATGFDQSDWENPSFTPKQYGIPFETINLKKAGRIDSHGTHVASLALKGLESTTLFPFAGDYGDTKYLGLISNKIKSEGIDFVNMSFSFPHYSTGNISKKTLDALKKMITENPSTVFFVAAGNNGRELTGGRFNCLYPACYTYDNVITIGATNDSNWRKDSNYEMAEFSNRSDRFVDLFAPGNEVNGALLGDMEVRYSGTSMASPNALNIAASLKEKFPNKNPMEIVEVMKKSATKLKSISAKFGVINQEEAIKILLQEP